MSLTPPTDTTALRAARAGRRVSLLTPSAFSVGLVCMLMTGLVALVAKHERGISGDEPFYLAMAEHPGGPHNFPYAYRVAVPWLVHIMPFREIVSFTILGLLAVGVAGGGLFALLREFEVGERLSAALALGFALSPTLWIVILRHFQSIDPASIMVMILGVLFIVRRQRLALLICLTIGTAVRESTMFLVPFTYVMWARRPLDREALADTALTCVLPVILYVVIRTQIDAVDKSYIPGYSGPFLTARIDLIKNAPWGPELRRLAYTYGVLWIVAPMALRHSDFARRGLVVVVLCLAAMTYAYDWDRVMFLAAPIFFVAAGQVLMRQRRRVVVMVLIAVFFVDIGYGIYLQAAGVEHGIDQTQDYVPVVQ